MVYLWIYNVKLFLGFFIRTTLSTIWTNLPAIFNDFFDRFWFRIQEWSNTRSIFFFLYLIWRKNNASHATVIKHRLICRNTISFAGDKRYDAVEMCACVHVSMCRFVCVLEFIVKLSTDCCVLRLTRASISLCIEMSNWQHSHIALRSHSKLCTLSRYQRVYVASIW